MSAWHKVLESCIYILLSVNEMEAVRAEKKDAAPVLSPGDISKASSLQVRCVCVCMSP